MAKAIRAAGTSRRMDEKAASEVVAAIAARVKGGQDVAGACAALGLSVPSYYRWRSNLRKQNGETAISASEAILNAAKKLFLRHGYGVNLGTIAKVAGVTRQTLYNHFGNKELLFGAVSEVIYQNLANPVLVIERNADFASVLAVYGRHFMRISLDPENIRLLRISLAAGTETPNLTRLTFAHRAAHMVPTVTDHIAAYLSEQMQKGVILPADPLIAAEMFMGSLSAAARNRALVGAVYDTPERLEKVLALTVEVFARGLGYRAEQEHGPTS